MGRRRTGWARWRNINFFQQLQLELPARLSKSDCGFLSHAKIQKNKVSQCLSPRASQALSRFTVLDLTRVRSGPTCVRQLADWGANVIKIDALLEDSGGEQPGGPRQGSDFQNLHRNKRAMTLNLKDPKGLEVFKRLAEQADVVVENFRPDVKAKLGIDYDSLRKINPRIVYGSISGSARMAPITSGRASIRSRRAWAD